jgi:hypothetical protein
MDKKEVKEAVLQYFHDHPDAQDTIEGITEWWIARSLIDLNAETVREVIIQMCADGLLIRNNVGYSSQLYRLNKRNH